MLIEAIARRRVVTAVYNGETLVLAPRRHLSRHGALFISALNTRRARREGDVPRLGLYKLAGMSAVVVTDSVHDHPAGYEPQLYMGDELIFSV